MSNRFTLLIGEPRDHDDPATVAALTAALSRILDTANRTLDAGGSALCLTCRGAGIDLGICSDCYGSGHRH